MPPQRLVSALNMAPSPAASNNIQKFVSPVNAKVTEVDTNRMIGGSFVRTVKNTVTYLTRENYRPPNTFVRFPRSFSVPGVLKNNLSL